MYVVVKTPQPQSLHSSALRVAQDSVTLPLLPFFDKALACAQRHPKENASFGQIGQSPSSGVCPTVCCKATLVSLAEELLVTEW